MNSFTTRSGLLKIYNHVLVKRFLNCICLLVFAYIFFSVGAYWGSVSAQNEFINKRYEQNQMIIDEVNEKGEIGVVLRYKKNRLGYPEIDLTGVDQEKKQEIIHAITSSYVSYIEKNRWFHIPD